METRGLSIVQGKKYRLISPFVFGMALLALPLAMESRTDFLKPPVLLPESTLITGSGANSGNMILADRSEKKDRVLYGTDSDPAFSQEEQEREEKEKEDRSWRMLERMNLYQGYGKKERPPKSGGEKQ
jgi:hypothetical protein